MAIQQAPPPFMDALEVQSIVCCIESFDHPINALEWGSGNSTLFFSSHLPPGSGWDSIEHDPQWYRGVCESLKNSTSPNVKLHHIPAGGYFRDGVDDGDYASFRNYILFPAKLDKKFHLILVDGRARVECMQMGWSLLAEDGVMVLHDAQRPEYDRGVPKDCRFLRITNPLVQNDGAISTLFMGKSQGVIQTLKTAAQEQLPGYMGIDSNVETTSNRRDHRAGRPAPVPLATDTAAGRCIFINTYYSAFLERHYQQNPGLLTAAYREQKASLEDEAFGDSDFYSEGLKKAGWQADDIIVNCPPLQQAWARENGCTGEGEAIALEQIRRIKPHVVYMQDMGMGTTEFLSAIRPHTQLIVGQIASPPQPQTDFTGFDIIFSSFPHFVQKFREFGITSYYQPLAFEPRVLGKIGKKEKVYPVTFVGGISTMHGKGKEILERVAELSPVEFWGYGAPSLPEGSPIRSRHHGEAWGLEMFSLLSQSRITINRHIDVAENFANNMRLFEATGCGTLLITDYKDNLHELFEIGREVVVYRSPEECTALIDYYLAHPDEAEAIARAGQARTLRDHTYTKNMAQTAEILERHLRYRREKGRYTMPARITDGYQAIEKNDITEAMISAWKDESIPANQRALVQQQLADMYQGKVTDVFQVLADIMRPYVSPGSSVLELGCASGYYYEILEYLLNRRIDYTGVDYSDALIAMAGDFYPRARFFAADGASLFFADRSFDLVISSCVLLHVPNYRQHIFETARVAGNFVVAHRTPVCRLKPTQYMKKFAYGVETVELVFNEEELLREFVVNGFKLIDAREYMTNTEMDSYGVTYLFRRP